MYQLYYYPCNASLAPHFILQALGVDFELVLIDRQSEQQKSADYLSLNPSGLIPTLVDQTNLEPLVLFESAAICLHLCERHIESCLMPKVYSAQRAKFYQWLIYLTNTLQAELMVYFYPQRHTINPKAAESIKQKQENRITDMLVMLDKELSSKSFLIGDEISGCDYYLLMLLIWCDEFSQPPDCFANLKDYLKRLVKRQEVINVCRKEFIDLSVYQ